MPCCQKCPPPSLTPLPPYSPLTGRLLPETIPSWPGRRMRICSLLCIFTAYCSHIGYKMCHNVLQIFILWPGSSVWPGLLLEEEGNLFIFPTSKLSLRPWHMVGITPHNYTGQHLASKLPILTMWPCLLVEALDSKAPNWSWHYPKIGSHINAAFWLDKCQKRSHSFQITPDSPTGL